MEINLSNLMPVLSPKASNIDETPVHVQVLVVGSGPAGFSAALYAARAELSPVVLTGTELGGQVSLTYTVENYPGFPDGVGGSQLVELFQTQSERFGARVEFDRAVDVDLSQRPFKVRTDNKTYLADSIIIATGATPRRLGVSGEHDMTGRGVSYCATCDGWFFKNKEVTVVGGGDSALEEAIFLTRYARSVTIVHRRDELRAGAVLRTRASQTPKISFLYNTIVTEIIGDEAVRAVRLKNVLTGEETERATDGVFIFIGHTPNTSLFKGQLEVDDSGYLVTDKFMKTNIKGVFAAGEVADSHFRQVITSAGMGAAAAMEANRFLEEEHL
jgi:thioredoxin reductase (NADPH)